MSITGPTPPQPEPLDTYDAAVVEARKDFARLARGHVLFWQLDPNGALYIVCSCDDRRRTLTGIEGHIREAIRKLRGPVKSK